jgi:hypothetical protein
MCNDFSYRSAVEQIFDINIACDHSTNEYYIENIDDVGRNGTITRWLLNSFSVGNLMRESKSIGDRILLENIPSAQLWLKPIVEAMRENRVVKMMYKSFKADAPNVRQFHPYFVKLYDKRWYVYGSTDNDPRIKVYALDRVQGIVSTDRTFELPDGFSGEGHLCNSIGILRMQDTKPCSVVVKADADRSKYLRTRPLHHSQRGRNVSRLFVVQLLD